MSSSTCSFSGIVGRAAIVAAVAAGIGFADSRVRNVVMSLSEVDFQTTTIPVAPPKPDGTGADGAGSSGNDKVNVKVPQQRAVGPQVSVEEAFALFQMEAPFIDARFQKEFEEGHVSRAMRMMSDELMGRWSELQVYLPGPIVVYCNGGECDASKNVAKTLGQAGFTKIHIMVDGYPVWRDAKHPTETGPEGGNK